MADLEMIQSIWIKWVPAKGMFGIQAIDFYKQEKIVYAHEVDFSLVFPSRPRPGISKMNISTDGVKMDIKQPFVIDGDIVDEGGKMILKLSLHHEK